jgi:hypothetical protein
MVSEVDHTGEILLLALRYVAGELGRDETAAFERRLDEDQVAREAVAEAVELAGAIAAAEPAAAAVLPMTRRRTGLTIAAGLAMAAAACVAWLIVMAQGPVGPHETESPLARASESSLVATLAWSTLREECVDQDIIGLPETELAAAPDVDDASDHGIPLWLLDAASLSGRRDGGTTQVKEL